MSSVKATVVMSYFFIVMPVDARNSKDITKYSQKRGIEFFVGVEVLLSIGPH